MMMIVSTSSSRNSRSSGGASGKPRARQNRFAVSISKLARRHASANVYRGSPDMSWWSTARSGNRPSRSARAISSGVAPRRRRNERSLRFIDPAMLPSCSRLGAENVLPRHVARHVRVLGQAEDPLAEDVTHDVGCPAFDRVGLRPQEAARQRSTVVAVGEPGGAAALSTLRVLALPRHAADALEVDRELLEPLV